MLKAKKHKIRNLTIREVAIAVLPLLLIILPPLILSFGNSLIPRYEWRKNSTGVTITAVYGWRTHVTVPDTIRGYPVTAIGDGAFSAGNEVVSPLFLP